MCLHFSLDSRVLHRRIRKGHAYYEVEWGGELVNSEFNGEVWSPLMDCRL